MKNNPKTTNSGEGSGGDIATSQEIEGRKVEKERVFSWFPIQVFPASIATLLIVLVYGPHLGHSDKATGKHVVDFVDLLPAIPWFIPLVLIHIGANYSKTTEKIGWWLLAALLIVSFFG